MPTIIFSPKLQLQQVEDFPEGCERTVKGAIHIRPGGTCLVSEGELTHLKSKGVAFTVVGARAVQPPSAAVTTGTAPAVSQPVPAAKSMPGLPPTPPSGGASTGAQGGSEK